MTSVTTKPDSSQPAAETAVYLFDNWFDPIEGGLRDRVREFIHAMIEGELDVALSRPRYARHAKSPNGEAEGAVGATGHRHGHRSRSLLGSFGRVELEVPRARLNTPDGKTTEWKSKALRAYQRRTLVADALIASTYLAGTNTRRVRRALGALFGGAVGKDTVSRVWRKVKGDWDVWNARSLADEPIVRLILDGTVVRVRLDRKATAISLLVVIGVRADGQKMLIAIKSMGGESTEAWRAVLDDLIQRGLRRPEFLIIDGASGLENAIAAVWDGVPVQRCTVHLAKLHLARSRPPRDRKPVGSDVAGTRSGQATVVVSSAGADRRGVWADVPADPRARMHSQPGMRSRATPTFYRLPDETHESILVACSKCDWKAAFDRGALISSHGADCRLTDLLGKLSAPGCGHHWDRCGAYCTTIAPSAKSERERQG